MSDPLNVRLMRASGQVHREAERVPFMVAFFKGELARDAYRAYLEQLRFVYETLEASVATLRGDAALGWLFTPELLRTDALREDISALGGVATVHVPLASTGTYVDRIADVTQTDPHRLIAHHWLRYLGYVMGQDMLNQLTTKCLGPGAPRSFYAFPAIDDPRGYAATYHERMNAVPLSEEQRDEVADEGVRAFRLQIAMTEELGRIYEVPVPRRDARQTGDVS